MKNTKFSVAMSVYKNDNPEHFKISVDSILNQTVEPTEVVLVVDGPVPEELDNVISGYEKSENFKAIRLPQNGGLGNALKICIENCSYPLVARMDADDIAAKDRFEKQLEYFEKFPETDVLGSNITEFIDEPDNIIGRRIVPSAKKDIEKYLKERCPFNHMTVMFKKEAVLSAGGYLDWFWNEDYYLWLRMYLNGAVFANLEDELVNVRSGYEMYNRRGGKKYFKSEAALQKYMLKNKIIGIGTYISNMAKRFIVQILLPNKIRGWVFRKFARN